jgi:hypothetical protein
MKNVELKLRNSSLCQCDVGAVRRVKRAAKKPNPLWPKSAHTQFRRGRKLA